VSGFTTFYCGVFVGDTWHMLTQSRKAKSKFNRQVKITSTKNQPSFIWIFVGILCVGVFFYARFKTQNQREFIIQNGSTAEGTIYNTAGEHLSCKYEINGANYEFIRGVPFQYLQDGESYQIKFIPEDPEQIVILFDKPVFSTEFNYDVVQPTSVERTYSSVKFMYHVNDTEYTRKTFYREGNSLSKSSYLVKYRVDDPRIGYLITKKSTDL
jgi:hypothetical protein